MNTAQPVIVNLDGTLIDSAPDIHAAVNAVLRRYGVRPLTLDVMRGIMDADPGPMWARILRTQHANPNLHRDMLASFMTRHHGTTARTRLYPGVIEALGRLADGGHPLGLCTGKPQALTQNILAHFGLTQLFDVVIGTNSLPQHSVDPAALRAALHQLGTDPQRPRAVFVGNHRDHAECAAAAGIPLALFVGGGYPAGSPPIIPHAAKFDNFTALPALIATLATEGLT